MPLVEDDYMVEQIPSAATDPALRIEDQVARCRIKGECLAQLLNHPSAARVPGGIKVQDSPPVRRNHKEAIEHTESKRWHSKEIHGGDGFAVVIQKRHPAFCWLRVPEGFPHPANSGRLRDLKAEHLQFTVDPWRAPGWVLRYHAEDEVAQFPAHAFSSSLGPVPRQPALQYALNPARCHRTTVSGSTTINACFIPTMRAATSL